MTRINLFTAANGGDHGKDDGGSDDGHPGTPWTPPQDPPSPDTPPPPGDGDHRK